MKTDTIKKRQRYESGLAGNRKMVKRSRLDDDDIDDIDDSAVPSLDMPIKQEQHSSLATVQRSEAISPLDSANHAFMTYSM